MGVDMLSIDVCVSVGVRLFMCARTSEMHLSIQAVREVRLGELLLQLHVIFRIHALNLVCKDSAFSCLESTHKITDLKFIMLNFFSIFVECFSSILFCKLLLFLEITGKKSNENLILKIVYAVKYS